MILYKRITAGILSFLFFLMNGVFSYSAETNFWAERRQALEKRDRPLHLTKGPNPSPKNSSVFFNQLSSVQLPKAPYSLHPTGALSPNKVTQGQMTSSFTLEHFPNASRLSTLLARLSPYGRVHSVEGPPSSSLDQNPVVLYIQDVHQQKAAQRHIAEMLLTIMEEYPNALIGLEGAAGPLDMAPFRGKDPILNRRVADFFLNTVYIAGPEWAGMAAPASPRLIGMEDETLYNRHAQAVKDSLKSQSPWQSQLNLWGEQVQQLKKRFYSPAMAKLDRFAEEQAAGRMPFGNYLSELKNTAKNLSVFSPKTFPSVALFLDVFSLEKKLDFSRVEQQRNQLLKELVNRLDPQRLQTLMNRSMAFRSGEVSYADYYHALKTEGQQAGVPWAKFDAFDRYVHYILQADRLNPETLLKEKTFLEEKIWENFTTKTTQQEVYRLSRDLSLLRGLVNLSLTSDDWARYQERQGEVHGFEKRLTQIFQLNTKTYLTQKPKKTPLSLSPFEEFYRVAESRNPALAQNLLSALINSRESSIPSPINGRRWSEGPDEGALSIQKPPLAVLVAGGYHRAGLLPLLTKNKCTVITLTPKLEKTDLSKANAYLSVFTRGKTPLEKLFDSPRISLVPGLMAKPLTHEAAWRRGLVLGFGRALLYLLGDQTQEPLVTQTYKITQEVFKISGARLIKLTRRSDGASFALFLHSRGGRLDLEGEKALTVVRQSLDQELRDGNLTIFYSSQTALRTSWYLWIKAFILSLKRWWDRLLSEIKDLFPVFAPMAITPEGLPLPIQDNVPTQESIADTPSPVKVKKKKAPIDRSIMRNQGKSVRLNLSLEEIFSQLQDKPLPKGFNEKLRRAHLPVYRSDDNGSIRIVTDSGRFLRLTGLRPKTDYNLDLLWDPGIGLRFFSKPKDGIKNLEPANHYILGTPDHPSVIKMISSWEGAKALWKEQDRRIVNKFSFLWSDMFKKGISLLTAGQDINMEDPYLKERFLAWIVDLCSLQQKQRKSLARKRPQSELQDRFKNSELSLNSVHKKTLGLFAREETDGKNITIRTMKKIISNQKQDSYWSGLIHEAIDKLLREEIQAGRFLLGYFVNEELGMDQEWMDRWMEGKENANDEQIAHIRHVLNTFRRHLIFDFYKAVGLTQMGFERLPGIFSQESANLKRGMRAYSPEKWAVRQQILSDHLRTDLNATGLTDIEIADTSLGIPDWVVREWREGSLSADLPFLHHVRGKIVKALQKKRDILKIEKTTLARGLNGINNEDIKKMEDGNLQNSPNNIRIVLEELEAILHEHVKSTRLTEQHLNEQAPALHVDWLKKWLAREIVASPNRTKRIYIAQRLLKVSFLIERIGSSFVHKNKLAKQTIKLLKNQGISYTIKTLFHFLYSPEASPKMFAIVHKILDQLQVEVLQEWIEATRLVSEREKVVEKANEILKEEEKRNDILLTVDLLLAILKGTHIPEPVILRSLHRAIDELKGPFLKDRYAEYFEEKEFANLLDITLKTLRKLTKGLIRKRYNASPSLYKKAHNFLDEHEAALQESFNGSSTKAPLGLFPWFTPLYNRLLKWGVSHTSVAIFAGLLEGAVSILAINWGLDALLTVSFGMDLAGLGMAAGMPYFNWLLPLLAHTVFFGPLMHARATIHQWKKEKTKGQVQWRLNNTGVKATLGQLWWLGLLGPVFHMLPEMIFPGFTVLSVSLTILMAGLLHGVVYNVFVTRYLVSLFGHNQREAFILLLKRWWDRLLSGVKDLFPVFAPMAVTPRGFQLPIEDAMPSSYSPTKDREKKQEALPVRSIMSTEGKGAHLNLSLEEILSRPQDKLLPTDLKKKLMQAHTSYKSDDNGSVRIVMESGRSLRLMGLEPETDYDLNLLWDPGIGLRLFSKPKNKQADDLKPINHYILGTPDKPSVIKMISSWEEVKSLLRRKGYVNNMKGFHSLWLGMFKDGFSLLDVLQGKDDVNEFIRKKYIDYITVLCFIQQEYRKSLAQKRPQKELKDRFENSGLTQTSVYHKAQELLDQKGVKKEKLHPRKGKEIINNERKNFVWSPYFHEAIDKLLRDEVQTGRFLLGYFVNEELGMDQEWVARWLESMESADYQQIGYIRHVLNSFLEDDKIIDFCESVGLTQTGFENLPSVSSGKIYNLKKRGSQWASRQEAINEHLRADFDATGLTDEEVADESLRIPLWVVREWREGSLTADLIFLRHVREKILKVLQEKKDLLSVSRNLLNSRIKDIPLYTIEHIEKGFPQHNPNNTRRVLMEVDTILRERVKNTRLSAQQLNNQDSELPIDWLNQWLDGKAVANPDRSGRISIAQRFLQGSFLMERIQNSFVGKNVLAEQTYRFLKSQNMGYTKGTLLHLLSSSEKASSAKPELLAAIHEVLDQLQAKVFHEWLLATRLTTEKEKVVKKANEVLKEEKKRNDIHITVPLLLAIEEGAHIPEPMILRILHRAIDELKGPFLKARYKKYFKTREEFAKKIGVSVDLLEQKTSKNIRHSPTNKYSFYKDAHDFLDNHETTLQESFNGSSTNAPLGLFPWFTPLYNRLLKWGVSHTSVAIFAGLLEGAVSILAINWGLDALLTVSFGMDLAGLGMATGIPYANWLLPLLAHTVFFGPLMHAGATIHQWEKEKTKGQVGWRLNNTGVKSTLGQLWWLGLLGPVFHMLPEMIFPGFTVLSVSLTILIAGFLHGVVYNVFVTRYLVSLFGQDRREAFILLLKRWWDRLLSGVKDLFPVFAPMATTPEGVQFSIKKKPMTDNLDFSVAQEKKETGPNDYSIISTEGKGARLNLSLEEILSRPQDKLLPTDLKRKLMQAHTSYKSDDNGSVRIVMESGRSLHLAGLEPETDYDLNLLWDPGIGLRLFSKPKNKQADDLKPINHYILGTPDKPSVIKMISSWEGAKSLLRREGYVHNINEFNSFWLGMFKDGFSFSYILEEKKDVNEFIRKKFIDYITVLCFVQQKQRKSLAWQKPQKELKNRFNASQLTKISVYHQSLELIVQEGIKGKTLDSRSMKKIMDNEKEDPFWSAFIHEAIDELMRNQVRTGRFLLAYFINKHIGINLEWMNRWLEGKESANSQQIAHIRHVLNVFPCNSFIDFYQATGLSSWGFMKLVKISKGTAHKAKEYLSPEEWGQWQEAISENLRANLNATGLTDEEVADESLGIPIWVVREWRRGSLTADLPFLRHVNRKTQVAFHEKQQTLAIPREELDNRLNHVSYYNIKQMEKDQLQPHPDNVRSVLMELDSVLRERVNNARLTAQRLSEQDPKLPIYWLKKWLSGKIVASPDRTQRISKALYPLRGAFLGERIKAGFVTYNILAKRTMKILESRGADHPETMDKEYIAKHVNKPNLSAAMKPGVLVAIHEAVDKSQAKVLQEWLQSTRLTTERERVVEKTKEILKEQKREDIKLTVPLLLAIEEGTHIPEPVILQSLHRAIDELKGPYLKDRYTKYFEDKQFAHLLKILLRTLRDLNKGLLRKQPKASPSLYQKAHDFLDNHEAALQESFNGSSTNAPLGLFPWFTPLYNRLLKWGVPHTSVAIFAGLLEGAVSILAINWGLDALLTVSFGMDLAGLGMATGIPYANWLLPLLAHTVFFGPLMHARATIHQWKKEKTKGQVRWRLNNTGVKSTLGQLWWLGLLGPVFHMLPEMIFPGFTVLSVSLTILMAGFLHGVLYNVFVTRYLAPLIPKKWERFWPWTRENDLTEPSVSQSSVTGLDLEKNNQEKVAFLVKLLGQVQKDLLTQSYDFKKSREIVNGDQKAVDKARKILRHLHQPGDSVTGSAGAIHMDDATWPKNDPRQRVLMEHLVQRVWRFKQNLSSVENQTRPLGDVFFMTNASSALEIKEQVQILLQQAATDEGLVFSSQQGDFEEASRAYLKASHGLIFPKRKLRPSEVSKRSKRLLGLPSTEKIDIFAMDLQLWDPASLAMSERNTVGWSLYLLIGNKKVVNVLNLLEHSLKALQETLSNA